MSNGGTVEELDAQVNALTAAQAMHRAIVIDAEQRFVADSNNHDALHTADKHRRIVRDYAPDLVDLRDEMVAALPQPRPA